jgi:hypothetical protein
MKSEIFSQRIEDEMVEGWKVKEDGDERILMFKPNYGTLGGHLLVALATVWWTLGLGNVAYAGYKYMKSPTKVVRDPIAERARQARIETEQTESFSEPLTP